MDLFQSMTVFAKVAEFGSFAGAARALDMSNPSVTRHVADLETHLQARLFNRSTRRLSLTETGVTYLERCRQVLHDVDEAALVASTSTQNPTGTLRVSAPVSFAVNYLGRFLLEYSQRFPKVSLDIALSDRMVDLVEDGYDLVIRIGRIKDSSLIARKIATARVVACAAQSYIDQHGEPQTPQDLAAHVCLNYSYLMTRDVWQFVHQGTPQSIRIKSAMQSNSGGLLREAAIAGMGIIMQPTFIVGDALREGKLRVVLPGYEAKKLDIYAIYPSRDHLSSKVRTFVDHLIERFGAAPEWDRDI
ncbi:MAG: LysR family transcriptional regulator [Pseudomonadota bacterium]